MSRRRRRLQMGNGGNGDNGHSDEPEPVVVLTDPSAILAPVLELEGLEPWAEIPGPALALEVAPEQDEAVLTFDDPAQLEFAAIERELDDLQAMGSGTRAGDPRTDGVVSFKSASGETRDVRVADEAEALAFEATEFEGESAESVQDDPQPVGAVETADAAPAAQPAAEAAAPDAAAAPAAAEVEAPPPAPPQPDPTEILYGEARDAAEAGRAEEAKQLYRQLLALHPTHVRARNNLALMLDAEGNHKGALAELDRALDIESENGTLLVNRGALLGAMGRYAAAERDLKKVLRVEPAHAEALFNLGVVMSKKGLWAEAVPHLKRAVELEPQRAAAHYYLGEALNHVDDLAGALAAYQRATELQPANPRALYGLGIIYDRLARPEDAAQMYRRSREVGRR